MLDKVPQLPKDIQWHFIGHLQSNKVKAVVGRSVRCVGVYDVWWPGIPLGGGGRGGKGAGSGGGGRAEALVPHDMKNARLWGSGGDHHG